MKREIDKRRQDTRPSLHRRWMSKRGVLNQGNVRDIYNGWAAFYDQTFGFFTLFSRRAAIAKVNRLNGERVLEIGVGTGASLPLYHRDKKITGIDISKRMIEKARRRAKGMPHVESLELVDAEKSDFPDDHFDIIVANHVLSVTPDPHQLCREMARVCKPGGDILIVNHFHSSSPALLRFEKILSSYAGWIGWRADFDDSCLESGNFTVIDRRRIKALPLFVMVHCRNCSRV